VIGEDGWTAGRLLFQDHPGYEKEGFQTEKSKIAGAWGEGIPDA